MSDVQIVSPGIASVLRQIPTLGPEDSVSRALDLLRYGVLDTLPIVDSADRLHGVVTLRELRPLLAMRAEARGLLAPIGDWARRPPAVGAADFNLDDARRALHESGETTLVVLDRDGRYLGVVGLADLVAPIVVRSRPAMVGGMATPFGVYLTTGSIQAGVGNAALLSAGVLLGALLAFSYSVVHVVAWFAHVRFQIPVAALWFAAEPSRGGFAGLGWLLLHALPIPLFLLLVRALPLAQYHAAEHQAVHALERGEPLRPEVVSRMPRVHPRCGTNIMAAGMMFTLVSQGMVVLSRGWVGAIDGALCGALAAALTWRSVGGFLQQRFTTRKAGPKHIASGIAAAEELEERFLSQPPGRPRLLRRIWCMGLPQVISGVIAGSAAVTILLDWLLAHIL